MNFILLLLLLLLLYIIIICPTLQWNETYQAIDWMKHSDNVWLIEPKGKLHQRK